MDNWKEGLDKVKHAIEALDGEILDFEIDSPASEEEIKRVELELGYPIVKSFRDVLSEFSSRVDLCWFLPEDYELPEELNEIVSGALSWDISKLAEMNQGVASIISTHFADEDDPIRLVWQSKLVFHETGNGDYLGIDLSEEDYGKIVYLSHEAADSHGYILADDFEDFLNRVIPLGYPGLEDWVWMSFTDNSFSGINPNSENAKKWKQVLFNEKKDSLEVEEQKKKLIPVDPKLLAVESDLNKLLDFCMRKRDLKSDMVASLSKHRGSEMLSGLIARVAKSKSINKKLMAYCICGEVLKSDAEEWIRSEFKDYDSEKYEWDEDPFGYLVKASKECLPIEEAFRTSSKILLEQGFGKLFLRFRSLAWLESPLTLDWIEANVGENIVDSWGMVAANSHFTWERAIKWINSGRPMSLVAIDAIVACYFKSSMQAMEIDSKLLNAPPKEEIIKVMQEYYLNDKVPRVRKAIEQFERHYK